MTGHAIGRFCCCLLAAGLVWLPAHAADTATDSGAEAAMQQLIKTTSADLDKLYKEHRTDDRAALETLIENDILPSVDRVRITRRVFRQYWSQLVKAGRQQEAEERVINALTRTYAAALSGYAGLVLSYRAGVPSGPAIILMAAGLYVVSVLFGNVGGLLRQWFPGRHLEA